MQPSSFAPILLFVYSRLHHVEAAVRSLQSNPEAIETNLIIYSDGPKNVEVAASVAAVRGYLKKIDGFKSVTVIERPSNYGLASSLVGGITEALNFYDSVIVVEDDLVVSPFFLSYMNSALRLYSGDDQVASIHGYIYPVDKVLPETFFLRGADCWGWATWKSAWAGFRADSSELLYELEDRGLINDFDFGGGYLFSNMLKDQMLGKIDSWAIRWHASMYLAGKLTLYPGLSLVANLGNDGTGTHGEVSSKFLVKLSPRKIEVNRVDLEVSRYAWETIRAYFCRIKRRGARHYLQKIKGIFRKFNK